MLKKKTEVLDLIFVRLNFHAFITRRNTLALFVLWCLLTRDRCVAVLLVCMLFVGAWLNSPLRDSSSLLQRKRENCKPINPPVWSPLSPAASSAPSVPSVGACVVAAAPQARPRLWCQKVICLRVPYLPHPSPRSPRGFPLLFRAVGVWDFLRPCLYFLFSSGTFTFIQVAWLQPFFIVSLWISLHV